MEVAVIKVLRFALGMTAVRYKSKYIWLVWTVEDYINLILSWEWWEDCCGRCDRAEVSD